MGYISDLFKKNSYILVASAVIFLIYLVLFNLRDLDDNRLVSWQWVFDGINTAYFFLGMLAGLVAALILSKTSSLERYPVYFLFASSFVISAFFWRESEAIVDASRYFTQAKHLEVYGIGYFVREWGRGLNAWTDMPLIPFVYGLIFRFFGESRIYIQIFTTSLFSATVALTYFTGRRLWNEHLGLCAGIFLMGIPYLYTQVPLILVDAASMFFLMLVIFFFIKALDNGGVMILISAVVTALAFFTKYSLWPLLSVLIVILFTLRKETGNPFFFRRGLSALLIAGIMSIFVFVYKLDAFREQFGLLLAYQVPGLKRWKESFMSTFFFQTSPLITLAGFYSVYTAIREKDKKYLPVILPLLFIILFQIHRIRYTIVVFPMLCLAASYGLSGFCDKEKARFISLSAAILSIVIAVFVYLPFMEKVSTINLKDAGRFLDTLDATDVEVITTPLKDPVLNPAVAVPMLDLFTKKNIYYDYIPDSNLDNQEIKESSLRFTWDYRNPGYYSLKTHGKKKTLVIISGERDTSLQENIRREAVRFQRSRVFDKSDDIFRHKTFVSVYFN